MFIGYNKECNDIASIEISIVNHKLGISGVIGEFMHEDKLYELIEDYFNDLDIESEYGYLVDDMYNDVLYDCDDEDYDDLRLECLEDLKDNLMNDNVYPYEVDKWLNPYVHTLHTVGQCYDEIARMMPLLNQGDFNYILDVWKNNQLDIISPETEDTINHIILRYDDDLMIEKIIELVDNNEL